ncbi:SET domain-containing protein [Lophiostoma macrostomum CBS 122681]|uniref:SET domain-containing protein n=1 Tax=Lophiostoma macrostomum CBS 122681 TaxID=1314788 RepID=A0A6A6SY60_9PLEO|nr:SET domain-containing protein [Lophiostoma macrostomum CBS 122681]
MRLPNARPVVYRTFARKVHLNELLVDFRDTDTVLFVKTVTSPYIYSSTITIAEDEAGDVARLSIGNLEDTPVDPLIPEGTVLTIKQPCWSSLPGGGYNIRIDHPTDVAVVSASCIPEKWRSSADIEESKDATKWKKEGDMMFLKKKFRKALEYYNHGLSQVNQHRSPLSALDFYRKKCGVNIVLLRLDDAATDLSWAIACYARSTQCLAESSLTGFEAVNSWLRNHSTDDPLHIADKVPRALKELAARIKFDLGIYQDEPVYNLPLISSYVGPLTLHVDAANYLSSTEIRQTSKHGRGLFAKRAFKAGDGTASPRPGALLFKELVQKLRWNTTLRKEFFRLDDGGYWKEHGWDISDGEDIPVDVFRVEKIRQLNCFSVPTRSFDLLNQPPNSNPELRNGFWIHASYVNHSCLPNTVRTFIGDVHFLRATRDIMAGEELTHQYVSPEIDIEARQEKYRGTWGFECDCGLCVVDGAVLPDQRRQRLEKFEDLKSVVMKLGERGTTVTSIKKIARGMRDIEALYSPIGEPDPYEGLPRLALVHPTLFLTEAWRGVKNVDRMLDSARQLLRNFGIFTRVENGRFGIAYNAGLINVEAVRALKYLAEGYGAKGEASLMEQCMTIAKLWFIIITGSETGMAEFLGQ